MTSVRIRFDPEINRFYPIWDTLNKRFAGRGIYLGISQHKAGFGVMPGEHIFLIDDEGVRVYHSSRYGPFFSYQESNGLEMVEAEYAHSLIGTEEKIARVSIERHRR